MSLRSVFSSLCLPIAAALLGGCASLPAPVAVAPSHALQDVASTRLARIARDNASPGGSTALSGFRLMPEAAFAFDARISLAATPRKSLDVQYYLIAERRRRPAAAEGAARGGLSAACGCACWSTTCTPPARTSCSVRWRRTPNIEVRLFNPLPSRGEFAARRASLRSLHEFRRINHRMHNKLLVADTASRSRADATSPTTTSCAARRPTSSTWTCCPAARWCAQMSTPSTGTGTAPTCGPIAQVAPLAPTAEQARRASMDRARDRARPAAAPGDSWGASPVGEQLTTGLVDASTGRRAQLFVDDPDKITRSRTRRYLGQRDRSARWA